MTAQSPSRHRSTPPLSPLAAIPQRRIKRLVERQSRGTMGGMSTAASNAFERSISPIIEILLPQKARDVVDYQPDPVLQQRIEELALRSTEGELTDDERAEYEGYIRANKFVAVIQRQARRVLGSQSKG